MGDNHSLLPDSLNLGMSSRTLTDIEAELGAVHNTREFHDFCHLCPWNSPAASALASLDQASLPWWRQECWFVCCCNHDAGTYFDAPSNTTSRSRTLASKVRPAFHFCVFLFRRLTWPFVGKITRWSVRSNPNKFDNLSCLSNISSPNSSNILKGTANLIVFPQKICMNLLFRLLTRLSIYSLARLKI